MAIFNPLRCLLVCVALAGLPAHAAGSERFAWPSGTMAAVSLAYDDGLASQLDHALPALDRHGLKASFYLTLASDTVGARLDEWRAAARNGHELGNHSLFHQCAGSLPGREWVQPHRDLERTSVAQMQDQVLLANTVLHAIDGRQERTLTVPCGDTRAADGNYLDAVAPAFVAIKLGQGGVTPSMAALDPLAVTVEVPDGASGSQLIALVEEAGRRGTMVNFTFHGIGGDYLSVSTQAHDELLAYLAEHRQRYWVDTFVKLMKYVRSQQQSQVTRP
jgi:peptidoglycan/xylan/chitin deacetylase (PgdA/CDA1 family)